VSSSSVLVSTRTSRILTTVATVLVGIYFLLPIIWVAIASTKNNTDLFGTFGLWFSGQPQLIENLGSLFSYNGGIYLRWILNSAVYAGVGAALATIIATAAGYAFAKFEFRGSNLMFGIVLGGVLVPGTALALPLYLLASQLGLANTMWSVLIPSLLCPFGVYLARVYASSAVPDELLEAARIDGAGEAAIFWRVALRMMTPALVTTFLFQFVSIWNNYLLSLVMLANDELYPLTLGLATWFQYADREPILYTLTVVGSFVAIIPLALIILSLQGFWRSGLTEGGVKG